LISFDVGKILAVSEVNHDDTHVYLFFLNVFREVVRCSVKCVFCFVTNDAGWAGIRSVARGDGTWRGRGRRRD